MAEIPVEKKSGFPWWLIPLLLLALLLIWLMMRGCGPAAPATNVNNNGNANRGAVTGTTNGSANSNGGNVAVVVNNNSPGIANGSGSNSGINNSGSAAGDRVTDVGLYGSSADKNVLVGRGANFTKVKVNRVLSDRVFTVTSGKGELFAFLDDKLNDGGKEHQITMRPGQIVNLGGEFRRVPGAETKDEVQNRDLNIKNYEQMKGQQVYLHVQSVEDAK